MSLKASFGPGLYTGGMPHYSDPNSKAIWIGPMLNGTLTCATYTCGTGFDGFLSLSL